MPASEYPKNATRDIIQFVRRNKNTKINIQEAKERKSQDKK